MRSLSVVLMIAVATIAFADSNFAAKNSDEKFYFVELVLPGSLPGVLEMQIMELTPAQALEKARLQEAIETEMDRLVKKYPEEVSDKAAQPAFFSGHRRKLDRLQQRFFSIKGEQKVVEVGTYDAPKGVKRGMVLAKEFVPSEVIETYADGRYVERHNFWRWLKIVEADI